MLQKILIQCKFGGEQKANYNWGSLFHGFLLKSLPGDVSEQLHHSKLRPFSQYVSARDEQQLIWHIGLWDVDIARYIVQTVMPLTEITLQQKNLTMEVSDIQKTSQSEQEYFGRFFAAKEPCRRYELEFLTPCTHKQDGKYALFPSSELIMASLAKRCSAYIQGISLDDSEAIGHLVEHTRIVRYSLRSAVYYLENTKISGYMGKITFEIRGPEQLARLAGALLSFAEYSGLGIKTALGMGGVRIKEIRQH